MQELWTEATADKDEIIVEVDANEAKMDALLAGADTIPGAVWDEATSGHVIAGTFGKLTQDTLDGQSAIAGLLHENSVIDQQNYDADGNLESARLRCYDSKAYAEAAGATGLLYTFSIAAVYTSGLLSSYTLVREP